MPSSSSRKEEDNQQCISTIHLLSSKTHERDVKRRQLEELFEKQQSIKQQMNRMEDELKRLDDEIDSLERDVAASVSEEDAKTSNASQWDEFLTEPATQQWQDNNDCSSSNGVELKRKSNVVYAPPPAGFLLSSKKGTTIDSFFSTTGRKSLPSANLKIASSTAIVQGRKPLNVVSKPSANTLYNNSLTSTRKEQSSTNYEWTAQIYHLLRTTFKLPSFRQHQEEIINATLAQKNVFVIMRTGGGKSLTYQLPALYEGRYTSSKKITFVISPLLSLIHDQEEQMNQLCGDNNVALSFTSNIGTSEHARRWALVRNPEAGVCLVFVTPEKVSKSGKFKAELEKLNEKHRLGRIVIDECHCCSQWGHDFRPDYTQLGMLKNHFPSIPVLAVTATASDKVREDCCAILNMTHNYQCFKSAANRPNLTYAIRVKSDVKAKVAQDMADFIQQNHPTGSGIVYTLSKKEAEDVAEQLSSYGVPAEPYHAEIDAATKATLHNNWMKNKVKVVVATIAFGLGINKPDVRFVLHHSISKTMENYYQESGRAGRDGKPADCVLYYSPKDVSRMRSMIEGDSQGARYSFWQMVKYAHEFGDDEKCRNVILRCLGEIPDNATASVRIPRPEDRDVTNHVKTVILILQELDGNDTTIKQLVDLWKSRDPPSCVEKNQPKDLTKEECERLVVTLLIFEILEEKVSWNNYGSAMYISIGQKALRFLTSPTASFSIYFPPRSNAAKSSTLAKKRVSSSGEDDGWLTTKRRRKSSSEHIDDSKNQKRGLPSTKRKLPAANRTSEVISIDLDDESNDDGNTRKSINYCEDSGSSELDFF